MGRHRRRTPELQAHFVKTAADLLEADGIDAITTRRVAAEAGSSLAALNELFGGKPGLVNAVALHGFGLLRAELELDESQVDGFHELLEVCRRHGRFIARHPRLGELMFSRPHATFEPTPSDMQTATAIRRTFTTPMAGMLGMRRSNTTVIDSSIGLVALLEGLARQQQGGMLGSHNKSAQRRFTEAITTYLQGAEYRTTNS